MKLRQLWEQVPGDGPITWRWGKDRGLSVNGVPLPLNEGLNNPEYGPQPMRVIGVEPDNDLIGRIIYCVTSDVSVDEVTVIFGDDSLQVRFAGQNLSYTDFEDTIQQFMSELFAVVADVCEFARVGDDSKEAYAAFHALLIEHGFVLTVPWIELTTSSTYAVHQYSWDQEGSSSQEFLDIWAQLYRDVMGVLGNKPREWSDETLLLYFNTVSTPWPAEDLVNAIISGPEVDLPQPSITIKGELKMKDYG